MSRIVKYCWFVGLMLITVAGHEEYDWQQQK